MDAIESAMSLLLLVGAIILITDFKNMEKNQRKIMKTLEEIKQKLDDKNL